MDKRYMKMNPTRNIKDSASFGGVVDLSDYFTNTAHRVYKRSPIAEKITIDAVFDRYCKTNIEKPQKEEDVLNRRNFKIWDVIYAAD